MIIYSSTKQGFVNDVLTNDIENIIHKVFIEKLHHRTTKQELQAWKYSLLYMNNVVNDDAIPNDAGISIEYTVPQTSKRIDFIISGQNADGVDHAVLIELKQWTHAEATDLDGIVKTYINGGNREVSHPSYQAWSYAALMEDFNETVAKTNISLKPCAFLHNYEPDSVITDQKYAAYTSKAPVFLKHDAVKLRAFIAQFVKHGDSSNIMYRIDNGRIRPSKNLADTLVALLQKNDEFVLIDDQKVVYETALKIASDKQTVKHVIVVEGGPGTGKSVVAINLLVELTNRALNTRYVTKNAAPRAVYESKLAGNFKKSQISNMFTSSGSYTDAASNIFDALIIDESQRLNAKSGMYQNLGENQIKEAMNASRTSIFFIDENQRVTLRDIGTVDEILRWAKHFGADVTKLELASQFRCNGSDGYIAWLDDVLQIRQTANFDTSDLQYECKVFDDPNQLRDKIYELNKINNKARMVAGYCWDWVSKNKVDPAITDVNLPEFNFGMRWNLASQGGLWLVMPTSVSEVGCIHTCQGLELDYIGVIVGPDLIVRKGQVLTDPNKRSRFDTTLHGYKKLYTEDPYKAAAVADSIIKNTYRTLMSRGTKACYIFSADEETRLYFNQRLSL